MITGTRIKKCPALAVWMLVLTCCACNTSDSRHVPAAGDKKAKPAMVDYIDARKLLTLSVPDTIKKDTFCFFSDTLHKDLFRLTIDPGLVKQSKARLDIITAEGRVIYTQAFDAFYFVQYCYEPQTLPVKGQEAEEYYIKYYWKSIKPAQFRAYFYSSIKRFFNDAFSFVRPDKKEQEMLEEYVEDEQLWKETMADSSARIMDITCFDCYEGGSMMIYSREQQKVITLLEHD